MRRRGVPDICHKHEEKKKNKGKEEVYRCRGDKERDSVKR